MQVQTDLKIVGAKFSKGVLDSGQAYDSTTLFVETNLDDSKTSAMGVCTAEWKWGTSENYKQLIGVKLPITVKATIEFVTNGKMQKTQLVSIKLPEARV